MNNSVLLDMNISYIDRSIFSFKFLTFLFILTISVGSESCLLSSVSYTICSTSNTNLEIKSKSFTKSEFISECHEDFVEKLFDKSCRGSPDLSAKRKPPTVAESYGYGFLAVFVISSLSVAGLLTFPILHSISFKYVLSLFTALAVGTLFGDTMFHLIPYALGLHGHSHGEEQVHSSFSVPDYVWKMLVSVLILYGFYLLETFLHSCVHPKHKHNDLSSHNDPIPHHDYSHVNEDACELALMNTDTKFKHDHSLCKNIHEHGPNEIANNTDNNNSDSICLSCTYSNESFPTHSDDLSEADGYIPISLSTADRKVENELRKTNPFIQKSKTIASTGWMVLIGDGIHNFADGLAIGAAFRQDLVLGMTTTLAIGLHELPHELGDYAVLIQSGFSHCRVVLWNVLSATTAFIGFFIGVTLSSNDHVRQWIFAITIGMFIYIALVDLLPTLLADEQIDLKRFIVVNIGFLLGIAIMFLLALFEDSLIRLSN